MKTLYRSTRETASHTMTSSQAVLQGLTPDGGLFVPVTRHDELPRSCLRGP